MYFQAAIFDRWQAGQRHGQFGFVVIDVLQLALGFALEGFFDRALDGVICLRRRQDALGARMRSDTESYARIIKSANIKFE